MAWAAILAPFVVHLVLLAGFGRANYDDYYALLPQLATDGTTGLAAVPVFARSNEHIVALPALLYRLNISLTHGDNRVLALVSLLLAIGASFLLSRLLPASLLPEPARAIAAFGMAALVASPVAGYNFVTGFCGILWFLPNVLLLASLATLVRCAKGGDTGTVVRVVGLGLLAFVTYGTSLLFWPSVVVCAALLGIRRGRLLALAGAGILACGLAIGLSVAQGASPGLGSHDVPRIVAFVAVFLGSVVAPGQWSAGACGSAALALSGLVVLGWWRKRREEAGLRLAPWISLGVFALGNACVAAVTRAGLGGARSSRYATVAVLFWIALAVATGILIHHHEPRPAWATAGVIVPLVLVVTAAVSWVRGVPVLRYFLQRAQMQPLAECALRNAIDDPDVLRAISIASDQVLGAAGLLRAWRHVPLDAANAPSWGETRVSTTASQAVCQGVTLRVWAAAELPAGVSRVQAAVSGTGPDAERIFILDKDGTIRGELLPVRSLSAPSRNPASHDRNGRMWAGYLAARGPLDELVADVRTSRASTCVVRPEWMPARGGALPQSRRRSAEDPVGFWRP